MLPLINKTEDVKQPSTEQMMVRDREHTANEQLFLENVRQLTEISAAEVRFVAV